MRSYTFLLLISLLFWAEFSHGQVRKRTRQYTPRYSTFEFGLLGGRSFSQLDGDYFTGFDKGGWYGGLRGIVNVSNRLGIHVEMLYSQKGSRIPHGTVISENSVNDRLVSMDFAEVPVLLRVQLSETRKSGFFEFGGYFGRLIDTSVEERIIPGIRGGTQYEDIVPEFKSSEVGLMTSLGIGIGQHLEMSFRYSFALSKIYVNENFVLPPTGSPFRKEVQFLRNYHLSLLLAYRLFSTPIN